MYLSNCSFKAAMLREKSGKIDFFFFSLQAEERGQGISEVMKGVISSSKSGNFPIWLRQLCV